MPNSVADLEERRLALDPLRSFCVTAPAGSGKTELLIQRFLTLLARVEGPQEVLAITFTRKAAAEMRARVADALNVANAGVRPGDEHAALTYDLAREVLVAADQRNWQLRHSVSELNIRTIDGLCASLTRQLPVESRFGGSIAAVDKAGPYFREAARGLLAELDRGGPVADDLATLLLSVDNNWIRLEELLVSMLASRDQWLVYLGTGLDRSSAETAVSRSLEVLCEETLRALHEVLAPWQSELLPLWQYSAANRGSHPVDAWPGFSPVEVAVWHDLAGTLLTNAGTWRKKLDKRCGFPADKGEPAERKQAMTELLLALAADPAVLPELERVRQLPVTAPGDEEWERVLACSRLLPRLVAELTVVFQLHGVVDHTQTALAALQALGHDDDPTELALALDYRLKHILVDEFQDTAVNQFELVRRLTRGWAEHNAAQPDNARTLFIVGDGMQSIYGFRDADVGLFIKAKQQGFDSLKLDSITLKTNFRSRAGIVDWVNDSFRGAFPPEDDIRRGEITFSAASAFHPADDVEAVEVLSFDELVGEAEWIAERVAEGMVDDDCDSIAVLVRRRADLVPLIAAFKARGISWQAQEIDALADSPVARDLQNLLSAIHNPHDRVAWLALMRAPWCGLDNADLLTVARALPDLWPALSQQDPISGLSDEGARRLAGLVDALIDVFAMRERLGLRDWAEQAWLRLAGPDCVEESSQLDDAAAFFAMLSELEAESQGYDPQAVAERVASLYASSSNAESPLQLMTLHKAKGLEFDWVFIPNLNQGSLGESRQLLLWDEYHAESGESCLMLAMDDRAESDEATLYNYLHEQRKHRRRAEAIRLLYVGATRAVKRLWLTNHRERDDNGEMKDPVKGSLLATIWESVATANRETPSPVPLGTVGVEPDSAALYRRAQALELSGSRQPPGEEGNLPEPPTDSFAGLVGTVVHQSLQRLSMEPLPARLDLSAYDSWWRSELLAQGLTPERADEAVERVADSVQNVLSDQIGRWLLSPEREQALSEFPLSSLLPDGRLAEYVIDRTFVADGQRWVVDYKSAMPESGQSLEAFLSSEEASYRAQLDNYARLLAELFGEPVRSALYFTAIPHWHVLN